MKRFVFIVLVFGAFLLSCSGELTDQAPDQNVEIEPACDQDIELCDEMPPRCDEADGGCEEPPVRCGEPGGEPCEEPHLTCEVVDAPCAWPEELPERNWPVELSVEEKSDGIEVFTGALRFELTKGDRATLRFAELDGRALVEDNEAPLLRAQLLQSSAFDSAIDYVADAEFLTSNYRVDNVVFESDDETFQATLEGRLVFDDDSIEFTLHMSARAGMPYLCTAVQLSADGEFRNRYVREVALEVPLELQWRKRIAQGGDRGMSWDTRYYYEFLRFLPADPDRNEWQHFAVQQSSSEHYRIWRSESESTSPIVHQQGVEAPGWTSAYDRQGGVLWGYRRIGDRAPKTLWVNAVGGAEAEVHLYPRTERAFNVRNNDVAQNVFCGWHEVDWVFFDGEHPDARPEDRLAELWEASGPMAGQRPRSFEALRQGLPQLLDAELISEAGEQPYVRGGLPMARGDLSPGDAVRLLRGDLELPVQSQPLAYWPDGSVKWLLVVFPLDGGAQAQATEGVSTLEFEVSLRNEERVAFVLEYGSGVDASTPDDALNVIEADDAVTIDTGPLRVELGTGSRWLQQVEIDGRPVLKEPSPARAFVDFLRTDQTYPVGSTHPDGRLDPGTLEIESVEVIEAGPLQAIVRLEGFTTGEEPTRVELRLQFFAQRSWIKLFHTVEFRHADPRVAFLQRMGLDFELDLDPASARVTVGTGEGPVALDLTPFSSLHQLSPGHYRVQSAVENGLLTTHEGRRSRGWLDVSGENAGLTVVMRNMWQDAPKQLAFRREEGVLSALLWPDAGPVMDVRRYSNYPHWAQGESAGRNNDWVTESFYPNGPLIGVARTHEMALLFHDGTRSPAELDAQAADVQSPPLVYAGYENYREADVTFAMPDYDRFEHMTANLDNFTNFWLFHQDLHNWYGWWDYGDIQHRYKSGGRGQFVEPEHLKEKLAESGERTFDNEFSTLDYLPQQDWHFDNGRWGWTNTEGLPGHYYQNEYMRTGRRDVFFAAEGLARHSRDVVTRHHGPRFGRGTRHGVQHFSDGNHEERQTVFTEFRFHYYFTGETRSRDVMMRLAEESYAQGRARRHVDHGARLYGLFTYWEMTGDEAAGELLRDYVHGLIVPEGISASAEISFDNGEVVVGDTNRDVNYGGMFFHTFGAMHALLEYHHLTADPELRDALVRLGASILGRSDPRMMNVAKVIAFAAIQGHQPAIDFLDQWAQGGGGFGYAFNMVSEHPARWSGELGRMFGNQPIVFFVKNAIPLVMLAFGDEPTLSERNQERLDEGKTLSEDDIARLDEADRRGFRAKRRLEWQYEYDDPELLPYFGPWRPEGAPR